MAKGLMHMHVPMSFFDALKKSEMLSIPEYHFRRDEGQDGFAVEATCAIELVDNLFVTFVEFVVKYCDGISFADLKQMVAETFEYLERPGSGDIEKNRYRTLSFDWGHEARNYFDRIDGRNARQSDQRFEHEYDQRYGSKGKE